MINPQLPKYVIIFILIITPLLIDSCKKDEGTKYFDEFKLYLEGNWVPVSVTECGIDVSKEFTGFILQILYDDFSNKDNDQTFQCQINQDNEYLPDDFSITLSPLTSSCKDNSLIFTTSNGYFFTITDNKGNFGSEELEFEINIFCNLYKSPGKYKWRTTKLN